MTDVVERLRALNPLDTDADEIESLRQQLAEADEDNKALSFNSQGTIAKLRQQLAELEDDEQKAVERCVIAEQKLAECREEREWLLDDVAKFRGERNALREELAERDVVIKDFAQIEHGMEQQLAECQAREKVLRDFVDVCIELDDYLTITVTDALDRVRDLPSDSTALDTILAECQARERELRFALLNRNTDKGGWLIEQALNQPSDSTALDTMLKAAKREALLEAAEYVGRNLYDNKTYSDELIRMAKELE
jgi:chromosome segregation ATPase